MSDYQSNYVWYWESIRKADDWLKEHRDEILRGDYVEDMDVVAEQCPLGLVYAQCPSALTNGFNIERCVKCAIGYDATHIEWMDEK